MVLSSKCWNPAKFARMASVEELDSSLTLLTHHPAKCRRSSLQNSQSDSVKVAAENIEKTRAVQVQTSIDALLGACSILTPPGTPYSVQTISPNTSVSPTFEYGSLNSCDCATETEGFVTKEVYLEGRAVLGNTTGGPNVVAIDNKIEQAMDLVKTHLTFAVREEVEILRSTIVDLEAKVAHLEAQNQMLRQFAPAEVLANLGYYLQKKKEAQASAASSVTGTAVFQPVPVSVQSANTQASLTMVIQQQNTPTGSSTPVSQHSAMSTQTVAMPQTATSMQQPITATHPPLNTQPSVTLLQTNLSPQPASISQQITGLPPQQSVNQTVIPQQAVSAQPSASVQIPGVTQQTTTTSKHLGNVAVATLPIGGEVIVQQQGTVVTNATAQLHYPTDSNPTGK